MDGEFPRPPEPDIIDLQQPVARSLPLVLASPHSGAEYPADFLTASRLDPVALRRSEDSFVDELFGAGPRLRSAVGPVPARLYRCQPRGLRARSEHVC